jgi:hypothetical protein
MFESGLLRIIFGIKQEKEQEAKKIASFGLYFLPHIIRVIKEDEIDGACSLYMRDERHLQ